VLTRFFTLCFSVLVVVAVHLGSPSIQSGCCQDSVFRMQSGAIANNRSPIAHWGWQPDNYTQWQTHSNRLIPVYTFGTRGQGAGIDLRSYDGENSLYRDASRLTELYGQLPRDTVNPEADYFDQTDIYRLQKAAAQAGKKYIFLFVFDGMDWQTTQAATTYNLGKVSYLTGRGRGTWFQNYTANQTTQYGFMVTSPHNGGTTVNVNEQKIQNPNGAQPGGYRVSMGGETPWSVAKSLPYLAGKTDIEGPNHAYTDSASSATSMTAGIKTYNASINIDPSGQPVETIAHQLQAAGWSVGAVTSVPISHATPAATYAHNVHRSDYQDLTRDLLGLPSISHPEKPLSGMDVLIGTGSGSETQTSTDQGSNFVPGNIYLTQADLKSIQVENGGKYVVSQRTANQPGRESLLAAAEKAAENHHRLFGFYGVPGTKHLPFQTANGDYLPPAGKDKTSETYTAADLLENPTLADMTSAAIRVLETNPKGFWLLVEPGDVDWANHDNNLDNSIGAVNSGDEAFRVVTQWVEENSNWDETLVIVTADHGHLLGVDDLEALAKMKQ
jgi:alkaline phosphatase